MLYTDLPNNLLKTAAFKKILFGAIALSIISVLGIGLISYFDPSFIKEHEGLVAFVFIALPLTIVMVSLPLYISSLKRFKASSIANSFDRVKELLDSSCSYSFQSTLRYGELSEDPSLISQYSSGGIGEHMLRGCFEGINYLASNFETFVYNSPHSKTRSTVFNGFYILLSACVHESEPIHIRTRNFFAKLFIKGNQVLYTQEKILLPLQGSLPNDPLMICAANASDVKGLVHGPCLERLVKFANSVEYEFSLFYFGNGDIGIAIRDLNIFMLDGEEGEQEIKNRIKRDVELLKKFLDMAAAVVKGV